MDGKGNTLNVAEKTRIHADGLGGTALLVSYGSNHTVNLYGEATALGEGGIAARFDFGDNEMGNFVEYRGSWMRTTGGSAEYDDFVEKAALPSALKGPLINSFTVTGLLAGNKAAIYIAENALVEQINILSGAGIYGDIISKWDPADPRIQAVENGVSRDALYTYLTFGQKLAADGTLQDDAGFALTLYGGIEGERGIRMTHRAGRLDVLGTVNVASLDNSGTLALYSVDETGYAATAEEFVNAPGSTLETGFVADGSVTAVQAQNASLSGAWAMRAMPDFYASDQIIRPYEPVTVTGGRTGSFDSVVLAANASPTLTFSLLDANPSAPSIMVSRAQDAYSRYAGNAGAARLGRALPGIGRQAQGDMRNLLAALDWSDSDGHEAGSALDTLGPEAYDASARASLAQQSEFNILILQCMLSNESIRRFGKLAADRDRLPEVENWQFWATPYGAGSWQDSYGGASSWSSTGIGLLAGLDRRFEGGFSLGAHVAMAVRRTRMKDNHDADIDTKAAFVGVQGLLAPDAWDGFWLAAQGRIGLESGEMDRAVSFNGYTRHNESLWTAFAGSALAGGGKDWFLQQTEKSLITAGPLAFLEYSFLRRPDIDEKNGRASRLAVDDAVYESLLLSLGAHAGWNTLLEGGAVFGVDMLAAWRHELLDAAFRTGAAFRGYGEYGFESATDLAGRDSLLVQGSLRLTHPSSFFAKVELGGEFFREHYTAVNVGLQLGWEF